MDTPQQPKQHRIPPTLQLNDASAKPGEWLSEAIGHYRHPYEEDLAVLEAWAPKFRW